MGKHGEAWKRKTIKRPIFLCLMEVWGSMETRGADRRSASLT